ncbi:Protein of unknown function (DUF1639 [Striga hermonthica]|uniref:DUF1639 family protein n=1 Tax=Striga hermonthica TaxID=68872 RepID=A0A9N7MMY9_STRHE|nr:Protein of unknown function (DUF1639 [Striga hermonthica]
MAMGTGRSSKALHNFTMPFELRWGNQKQMRCTKVNSGGHNHPPRRFAPLDSHRRRRREDSVQHPRFGSEEERGRKSGSPFDFARGSYKSSRSPPPLAPGGGRGFSDCGDDGISAVREKLMFDLQTAAERMKDAVFRDGFVKGEASSSPPPLPLPPPLPATPMEEIEEDFYGIVGHRPARRPKKRARIVQRQLDTLFPGLWLREVTADMYKIDEAAP